MSRSLPNTLPMRKKTYSEIEYEVAPLKGRWGVGRVQNELNQTFDLIVTLPMMNRSSNFVWSILIAPASSHPPQRFFCLFCIRNLAAWKGWVMLAENDPGLLFGGCYHFHQHYLGGGRAIVFIAAPCFWLFCEATKWWETRVYPRQRRLCKNILVKVFLTTCKHWLPLASFAYHVLLCRN
jgi:hypothetical protein